MIKAKMTSGDVFFGLSQKNIERLRGGQDLATDCFPIEVNCRVLIQVVPAGNPMGMLYTTIGRQPRLSLAWPDDHLQDHLQRVMDVTDGVVAFETQRVGAPFDLFVAIGETEQAIIEQLDYTGPVVNETQPAAGVH